MKEMVYSKVEGSGEAFLILHGFLGMSDNWKSLGIKFAEEGFEVHMLDMRNHGRSFHSDAFTYTDMVQDVKDYMDANQLEEAVVLGHSMGGKVAMQFAVSYPERVSKLIVADISPRQYAPHHQEILAGLSAIDFSLKPSRAEVDEVLSAYVPDSGTRQFLMKSLYWVEPGQLGFRFNLKAFVDSQEVIGEALPAEMSFEGQTLFLKGANSNYIQSKDEELILKHFPNSSLVEIANAGHWLHAENPKDFFSEVVRFLAL
ncbi:alpha/beta fold hydrolase [Myroides guanonis]|nr:alpha/beta fold hydrolase [Myroides guanonis]